MLHACHWFKMCSDKYAGIIIHLYNPMNAFSLCASLQKGSWSDLLAVGGLVYHVSFVHYSLFLLLVYDMAQNPTHLTIKCHIDTLPTKTLSHSLPRMKQTDFIFSLHSVSKVANVFVSTWMYQVSAMGPHSSSRHCFIYIGRGRTWVFYLKINKT